MTPIRVQYRPGREEGLERLLPNLSPAGEVVVDDEDPPNPLRGYRKCLGNLPEQGHVAVIQDDVIVCRNFQAVVDVIAENNQDVPVSLFLSKAPRRTFNLASLRYGRSRYVDVHPQDLVHVVAIVWPVHKARAFLDWMDANPRRLRNAALDTSDDANLTRWMSFTKQRIRCTVPSIVEHPDDLSSTVNQHKVKGGADGNRTAAFWIGDNDPLALDWTR